MLEGLTLLSLFWPVFFLILAWIIIYGILEYTKVFNKNLNSIIAFAGAVLLSISDIGRNFLGFTISWLVNLAIIIFFIILLFRTFGIKESTIIDAGKSEEVITWVLVAVAFILFFGFGKAFPTEHAVVVEAPAENMNGIQNGLEMNAQLVEITHENDIMHGGEKGNYIVSVFRNPAILGLIVILFIAAFAVMFLTKPVSS